MEFEWDDEEMMLCQEQFNNIEPEKRIFLSQYDLAKDTTITDSNLWKKFLNNPKVAEWIDGELALFMQTQQRKLVRQATIDNRSVGTAQMLTALTKMSNDTTIKEGPVFIYSCVPLTEQEAKAPNAIQLGEDVFSE